LFNHACNQSTETVLCQPPECSVLKARCALTPHSACNKNKPEIAAWLKSLYETFGTIDKIALRQAFAYGEFILRNKAVT